MAKPRHTGNDANLEAARTLLRAAGYEDEAIEGAFFVLCNGTDGEAVSDELLSAREVCDLIGISLALGDPSRPGWGTAPLLPQRHRQVPQQALRPSREIALPTVTFRLVCRQTFSAIGSPVALQA
jgi:hypothetical protein